MAEGHFFDTVAEDTERAITEDSEDDNDGEVDLERVEVVLVEMTVQQTSEEIIGKGEEPSGAESVVGTNVGHDSTLGWQGHTRLQEVDEKLGKDTLGRPLTDREEDQLVTSKGVLFPTCKLIVDGKRHTFLETILGVTSETDEITSRLQTESHIEILRHSSFRPPHFLAVGLVGNGLNGSPAEDSVVTDERSNITGCDSVLDLSVDEVGEEGDTALEERVCDVHDTGGVLEDSDFGRKLHFGNSVEQAVGRHTGIGVDNQNVVAHTDVTISPGAALVLLNTLHESGLVGLSFVFLSPVTVAVDQE